MTAPEILAHDSYFVGRPIVGSEGLVKSLLRVLQNNPLSGIKIVSATTVDTSPRRILAISLTHPLALSEQLGGRDISQRFAFGVRKTTKATRLPAAFDAVTLVTGNRIRPSTIQLAVGNAAIIAKIEDEQKFLAERLRYMRTPPNTEVDTPPSLIIAEIPASLPKLGMAALAGVMENARVLEHDSVLWPPEALLFTPTPEA